MSEFDSLTFALEKWFDKPWSAIPRKVRMRIEQDFMPIPWDNLSPVQRREVAMQYDYSIETTLQSNASWPSMVGYDRHNGGVQDCR